MRTMNPNPRSSAQPATVRSTLPIPEGDDPGGSVPRRGVCFAMAFAFGVLVALGSTEPGSRDRSPAEDLSSQLVGMEIEDSRGDAIRPFLVTNATLQVVIFISNDCPISNKYAPEIRRLHGLYRAAGVRFMLVHPMS